MNLPKTPIPPIFPTKNEVNSHNPQSLLELHTDPASLLPAIEKFLQANFNNLKREGAVVGLSGGLDSAVTAAVLVRSLGKDRVHLVNMPEVDSKPLHRKHARRFARELDIPLHTIRITPTLRAMRTYRILPLRFIPGRKLKIRAVNYGRTHYIAHSDGRLLADRLAPLANSWIARANAYVMAKHRIRMVALYQYAEVRNLMVVGAANRTEWLTGTFSKWGVDHCADVMPLVHLYRTQLEKLAEFLEIPEYIRTKDADPDIVPGLDNKAELMGGFPTADQILYNLEQGRTVADLCAVFDPQIVELLVNLKNGSKHMRESPYHL
ncbi:MAG: NAD(+) synthase [Promethearchaeota archaeon]